MAKDSTMTRLVELVSRLCPNPKSWHQIFLPACCIPRVMVEIRFAGVDRAASYRGKLVWACWKLKANSHLACRAYAVPLPCRAHAAKGLECVFHLIYTVRPCLINTSLAVLKAISQGHGTAQHGMSELTSAVERRRVGYLPAFGFFRLPRGSISIPDAGGQCEIKQRLSACCCC